MELYQIIKEPHITEKANLQKRKVNQISFKVHPKANKIEIKDAVQKLFKTKVTSVQTMNLEGKRRRLGRHAGKKPDWKKAVVRLAPGQNIEFFEGM